MYKLAMRQSNPNQTEKHFIDLTNDSTTNHNIFESHTEIPNEEKNTKKKPEQKQRQSH